MLEFISVPQVKSLLQNSSIPRKSEQVPLSEALGRITYSPVIAPIPVPLFDNSGMDGYAICFADAGDSRKVVHMVQAGASPSIEWEKGTAVRIFTGAPVPKGADTVIQQEWVTLVGDQIFFDLEKITLGMHVRKAGAQCQVGEEVIPENTLLTPGSIGLLASLGITAVEVIAKPKVGLILTGDEIVESGTELLPGQIFNSNGPAIQTYLTQLGLDLPTIWKVKDQKDEVVRVIREALNEVDVLLLTGGISVGDFDFVKPALEENGVDPVFYKVKQRPGKPLLVGSKGPQIVFALPGNPASVLSCFIQYVKPVLLTWMGDQGAWTRKIEVPLAETFTKKVPLTFFLKAKLENGKVHILPGQESFNLLPFGIADGLVEIPEELESIDKGSLVIFYPW